LVLGGCIKMESIGTFYADDTYDVVNRFTFEDQSLADYADAMDKSVDAVLDDPVLAQTFGGAEATCDNYTLERYSKDGYSGFAQTCLSLPISELNLMMEGANQTVEHVDGRFTVTGSIDTAVIGLDQLPADTEFAVTATITYIFPGKVLSSTGEIDGNSVTFDLDLTAGVIPIEVVASDGTDGSGGLPGWVLPAAIGGGVVLVLALALVLLRTKRSPQPPAAIPVYRPVSPVPPPGPELVAPPASPAPVPDPDLPSPAPAEPRPAPAVVLEQSPAPRPPASAAPGQAADSDDLAESPEPTREPSGEPGAELAGPPPNA
jgi:hypothetical protein